MLIKRLRMVATLALSLLGIQHSAHAASWIESSNGDMSNSGLSPSSLSLNHGSNPISGNFGAPDLDYLAVTVPPGFVLSAIVTGVSNNTGLSRSFIGVQAGSVMTVPPNASSAAGLLGWTHYGGADGVNLLPSIAIPKSGSTGFTPPLAAGTYTFWFNEVSSGTGLTYDFDFQVQAAVASNPTQVPMPLPALIALALMLVTTGMLRRRS
ncbi:MAG: hypothetical protein U1F34_03945 [Gammaproteobacteria bacterium]